MSITYVKGDLFEADEHVFAHGCNCQGFMGSGFALQVRDRYPAVYLQYKMAHKMQDFYPGVAQPAHSYPKYNPPAVLVYNLGTQDQTGANARLDYVAQAMRNMKNHMDYVGNKRVAMPKIGCGIGGLDWESDGLDVRTVIEHTFFGLPNSQDDYDIVVYEL